MPLKIKGGQIKHSSIELEHIEDIDSAKILGRGSDDGTGTTSLISSQDIRTIAGLGTTDNVQFSEISGDQGVFASLDADGSVIFESDLSISGNLTIKGDKTNIDTTNLTIDDPIIYLSKGNASDLLDIGIIGSYKSTDSGASIISNNNFDSTVDWSSTDWVNVSSGGAYYITYQSSTKNIYFRSRGGGTTAGAMIYQDIELSVDTSGDKSYRFEIEIKVNNSHSSTYADLSFWERSVTPAPNNFANSYDYERRWISTIPGTEPVPGDPWSRRYSPDFATWSSNTITPSSDLSDGFRIAIRVGNSNHYSSSVSVGSMYIDGPVKLYEIDNSTGNETEIVIPSEKYSGIFRDADDGKFKLFDTGEDLSSSTTVTPNYTHISGYEYSVGTLVSDIEGDITFSTNRTFTLSGDLGGSATFDGSSNVNISSTVQDDSIQYTNIDFLVDEDDMNSDSSTKVPTQQSVKAYADSSIASGGFSDLEAKDMKMVSEVSSGVFEFVKVKYVIEHVTVNSSDESSNYITIGTAVDSEFESLSSVYLNGQKLRYSDDDGTSNDYWFPGNLQDSATKHSTDLTADDTYFNDYYGSISLSQDGNVLSVGAARWDRTGGTDAGGVYIYDWNSSNEEWDKRGDVLSPTSHAGAGDRFGQSTALSSDGTYLAVGALLYSGSVNTQGAAYVYKWNSSTSSWDSHGSRILASDAGVSDYLSNVSISSDGTILAVSARYWDASSNILTDEGAVYIYDWNSTTEDWDQRTYESGSYDILTADDDAAGDHFGRNVSLSANGEILFVGAPEWEGDDSNQGGVYIYDWNSSQDKWVQRGDVLESNSPSSNSNFGWAVETNGDGTVLLVTEYFESDSGQNIQLFDWNSSTNSWDYRRTVSSPSESRTNFGFSVSINSDADKFCVGDTGYYSPWEGGKVLTYDLISASSNDKVNFNDGKISENDQIEIKYFIKY